MKRSSSHPVEGSANDNEVKGQFEGEQWTIAADEPAIVEGNSDGNFLEGPEIAESEDDEFEDDLTSQENSTDDDEEVDDDFEDEKDASSDSNIVRRRRIS